MKKTIALLCAALLVFALAGCGGGGGPEETVAAFFDAAKTIDIEGMNACLSADQALTWDLETQSDDENAQSLMQLLRTLASKIDYTLADAISLEEIDTVITKDNPLFQPLAEEKPAKSLFGEC